MNRRLLATVVGAGLAVLAVALAVTGSTASGDWPVTLVVTAGLIALGWQLRRRRARSSAPAQRGPAAPPERTPDGYPLSGTGLSSVLADAEAAARAEDDIAAGLAVARPRLRHTLETVLLAAGHDWDRIDAVLEDGAWTDEPAAAATLDPAVPLPALTRRERVFAWLFPERFVRAYVEAAVTEITALADGELPTVPGGNAPRPIPVRQPSLARLREGPDGPPRVATDADDAAPITDGRAVHEALGVLDEEESP